MNQYLEKVQQYKPVIKIAAIFIALVVCTVVLLFRFVEAADTYTQTRTQQVPPSDQAARREIASKQSTKKNNASVPDSVDLNLAEFALGCLNGGKMQGFSFSTSANYMKLSGKICLLKARAVEVTPVAQAHDTHTFFDVAGQTFVTDLIPLSPGQNTIDIKFFAKKQRKGEAHHIQLSIERKTASE